MGDSATGREVLTTGGFQADLSTPTPGTTGTLFALAHYQSTVDQTDGLETDDLLGVGYHNPYDEGDPAPVLPRASGQIPVPTDMNQLLFWLTLAFGPPTTVDDTGGNFTHTFDGTAALPSATLESQFPDGQWKSALGVMVNSMTFGMEKGNGFHRVQIDALARQVDFIKTGNTAPLLATPRISHASRVGLGPSIGPSARLLNYGAKVKINGVVAGDLAGGSLTMSNNLTPFDGLDGTAFPTDMDRGIRTFRMSPTIRLSRERADNDILDLFQGAAGTPFTLAAVFEVSATQSLEITFNRARAEKRTPPISGPGILEFANTTIVSSQSTSAAAVTAVLKNQVDGLVIPS